MPSTQSDLFALTTAHRLVRPCRSALTSSVAALAISLGAVVTSGVLVAPAHAQDQDEEVIVTGVRASLKNSPVIRREKESIIDTIRAGDIGNLPRMDAPETETDDCGVYRYDTSIGCADMAIMDDSTELKDPFPEIEITLSLDSETDNGLQFSGGVILEPLGQDENPLTQDEQAFVTAAGNRVTETVNVSYLSVYKGELFDDYMAVNQSLIEELAKASLSRERLDPYADNDFTTRANFMFDVFDNFLQGDQFTDFVRKVTNSPDSGFFGESFDEGSFAGPVTEWSEEKKQALTKLLVPALGAIGSLATLVTVPPATEDERPRNTPQDFPLSSGGIDKDDRGLELFGNTQAMIQFGFATYFSYNADSPTNVETTSESTDGSDVTQTLSNSGEQQTLSYGSYSADGTWRSSSSTETPSISNPPINYNGEAGTWGGAGSENTTTLSDGEESSNSYSGSGTNGSFNGADQPLTYSFQRPGSEDGSVSEGGSEEVTPTFDEYEGGSFSLSTEIGNDLTNIALDSAEGLGDLDFGVDDFGAEDFADGDFGAEDFGDGDFGAEDFGDGDFGAEDFGVDEFADPEIEIDEPEIEIEIDDPIEDEGFDF